VSFAFFDNIPREIVKHERSDASGALRFVPLHEIPLQVGQGSCCGSNGGHATLTQPADGDVEGFDARHGFAGPPHKPGLPRACIVTVEPPGRKPVLRHVEEWRIAPGAERAAITGGNPCRRRQTRLRHLVEQKLARSDTTFGSSHPGQVIHFMTWLRLHTLQR